MIVLAAVAAYSNSFDKALVFDDISAIVDNPSIRDLGQLSQVMSPPPGAIAVVARPVVNLSLAINYALGGKSVWGYHLFNLLVHILAALALFAVVRRTFALVSPSPGGAWVAAAVALIWVAHPLHTESVTYIVQRAEAMVGLFYLLTLYCFIRGATGDKPRVSYALAIGCCALGMASKEVMVSAPVVVLLYDRVFLSRSFKAILGTRWGVYVGLAATWGLLFYLVGASGMRESSFEDERSLFSLEYLLTQARSVVLYLRLSFWPDPLVLDYGRELAGDLEQVALHGVLVLGLLVGTGFALHRLPWLGFLGVWFFAILAPTTSFVFLNQVAHEHRMYLSLAAVVTIAVVGARSLLSRFSAPPWIAAVLVVVIVGLSTYASRQRNRDYHSVRTLWEQQVADLPDAPQSHANLGALLLEKEQDRAIRCFDRAIALKKDYYSAYLNRAEAHRRAGNYQQAVDDATSAIQLKGKASDYFVRGNAHTGWGRFAEAAADFSEVIKLDPKRSKAYTNRAFARQQLGQLQQAIADLTRAIALAPDKPESHFNRGAALVAAKRYDQAVADFTRSIALDGKDPKAFYNRGNAHHHAGRLPKAIADFSRAIELDPRSISAYHNRAVCLLETRDYRRAWDDVRRIRALGAQVNPALVQQLTAATGQPGP